MDTNVKQKPRRAILTTGDIANGCVAVTDINTFVKCRTALGLECAQKIIDHLPHGSGVDYDWNVVESTKTAGVFVAYNGFHAMNEVGMYCHTYPFKVRFSYNPSTGRFSVDFIRFIGCRERQCCGYDLQDYLYQLFADTLEV